LVFKCGTVSFVEINLIWMFLVFEFEGGGLRRASERAMMLPAMFDGDRVGENSARNFGPFKAAKFWNSGKF